MGAPDGLGAGGSALWVAVSYDGMPERDVALLTEACRARDRLDKLDRLLCGDVDVWSRLVHNLRTEDYELRIDDALVKANSTAAQLRGLLAALPEKQKPAAKGTALDELAKRRAGTKPAEGRAGSAAGGKRRT